MKSIISVFFAIIFSSQALFAGGDAVELKTSKWPFDGIFGYVDKNAAQRGFKVYKEVCSACHSMNLIAFRNLEEIGFSGDEVKSLAKEYEIEDGPNESGDSFTRPGMPSDKLPSPYPNENAARASNNGAHPPDLSLMIKARPNGANYVYSLLNGYGAAPASVTVQEGMYYNSYFPGGQIAMAPPLFEGQVSFDDNSKSTIHDMSKDIVVFLQWAAEPEMQQRKEMGIKVLLYLGIATILFFVAKERIWRKVK